jgi:Zn-dependent protease with chaperone function
MEGILEHVEDLFLHGDVRMRRITSALAGALLLCGTLSAQTAVSPPKNKYTPAQDVELGRQAAQEVRQQMPILNDDSVTSYVEGLGHKLVAVIPAELQHQEFRYTFAVVNVREINAFALPGGPMFVNRGMIESARTEGEVVGVMAHELSHVILRHGTAQASKATPYEVGSVLGQIAGAIIGGGLGQVVSGASQFGFGAAFLRFSREFEKEADIEGTHLMAQAGYDPRDMANVFKTIEEQSGPGGPQWLSDHPNPGNRYEYINQEADRLRVTNPIRDTRTFEQEQAHLKSLPAAPTTEEATRGRRPTGTGGRTVPRGNVPPPSSSYRSYSEGDLFRVSVPSNWRELPNNTTVTFAPDGAYNNQGDFTHGVEIGISRNESHDLSRATDELLASLAQSNRDLSRPSGYERATIAGRPALHTVLSNSSAAGGRENVDVYTLQLRDGNLLYLLGVAPRDVFSSYQNVFGRIVQSLELRD